jgi:hypothetical protein
MSVSGQRSVVMRPRRLTGTSRRSPIDWPQRASGVRRPHVPSTLLEPRALCRSTSRQASVRETPNGEGRRCVRGRRIRRVDGLPEAIRSSTWAFTFSTPASASTTGVVSEGVAPRPASTSTATLFTGANVSATRA